MDTRQLVLSVAEAAAMLGISKDLAYDLIARGELPSLRLGPASGAICPCWCDRLSDYARGSCRSDRR